MSSVSEAALWITRILALSLLATVLATQINMVKEVREEPRHLELALYRQRLLTGPHGVVARDNDGRVMAGFIDEEKLEQDYLEKIYSQEEPVFAARLSLYDSIEKLELGEVRAQAEHYPELLKRSLALAQAGVRGRGSASYERRVYPFLIGEDELVQPVWLEVEVIRLT